MTLSLSNRWKMNKRSTKMSLAHFVATLDLVERKPSIPLSKVKKDK